MDESILIKYLQGKCTDEQSKAVEEWCALDEKNRQELEQLYCTLFITRSVEVMNAVDTEASLSRVKKQLFNSSNKQMPANPFRLNAKVAMWIAASFLVGMISAVVFQSSKTLNYSVNTLKGQRAQATLPDGSKVWLNGDSEITYHDAYWGFKREVELVGEAYFEVAHKKISPFVVTSKDIHVNVLGTKFNVRAKASDENMTTTLFEGSVKVNANTMVDEFLLIPGQTLNINTKTKEAQLLAYAKPVDVLLWIDGNLKFDNNSLHEITETMEKLYDVRFIFEDENLKDERFTGSFTTDNSPEEILKVLTYTNYFKFSTEGNTIRLKRR